MKQVVAVRGEIRVVEVPEPTPGAGQVLVRVANSLISAGTETTVVRDSGKSVTGTALRDPRLIKRAAKVALRHGVGVITAKLAEMGEARPLGYSCAGYVVSAGEAAPGFAPGQLVACAGAGHANHAELVAVPRNLVAPVPEGVSAEEAATATVGAIALQGVRRAEVVVGETVAVIGLGLIGQLTAQILHAAGCRVIGADVDPHRVDLARQSGASVAVHAEGGALLQAVMGETGGHGADAALIAASASSCEPLTQAIEVTRKRGRVVVVGAVPLQFERSPFYEKELELRISCSYGPGRYDAEYEELGVDYPYAYVRWTENRNLTAFLNLVAGGKVSLEPIVQRRVPIDEAPAAYEALKNESPRPLGVLISYPQTATAPGPGRKVETAYEARPVRKGIIRIAVIGAGNIAQRVHLPNLKRLSGLYRIEGIVEPVGTRAESVARKWAARFCTTDYQEALADEAIDAVLIATPHGVHASLAAAAARAGKAVLLEKPMAISEEELSGLIDVLEATGVPFTVGFNRRHSSLAAGLREAIGARTGPLVINYRVNSHRVPEGEALRDDPATSRAIGEACHMFDFFNFLVGAPVAEVAARGIGESARPGLRRANFAAVVRYADGSVCNLIYTTLGEEGLAKERIEAFVEGRAFVLDDFRTLAEYAPSGVRKLRGRDKGYLQELQLFGDFCQGRRPAPIPIDDLVSATRVSLAVDARVADRT